MSHRSDERDRERDRDRDRCRDRDVNRDRSRERDRNRDRAIDRCRDRDRDREADWRYNRKFEDRSHSQRDYGRPSWLPLSHHRSRSPSADRSPSSSSSRGYRSLSRDRIHVNYRSRDTSGSRRNRGKNETASNDRCEYNEKSRDYSESRPLFGRCERGCYGNKSERNCRLSMLKDLPYVRELNTDVKSHVSKEESCVEKNKYPDDKNKLCSYCGDHITSNQLITHEGQGYHSNCFKTHKPKGKDALAQFKRHVKSHAVLLALHVNYVYCVAPQPGENLSKKESSRRRDAKREKREAKVKELLQYVSAFRNTVSGNIIIHLVGLDPDDRYTGELDELIDKRLEDLLWGEQFDVVYKTQRLNSHEKLDRFGDFISLYVAKSNYVTTLDYKTKVVTDNCLQEPDQSFVNEFLRNKQNFEEEFPQLGEDFCTEDIELLTENRSVQFKSRSDAKTIEEIVDAIKSLRLTEYISAHSKLEKGGSFFYGVKENLEARKGYGYMTKRTCVQTSFIKDPESLIQLMLKTIRQNVLVCGYQGEQTNEDVVKVTCVSEKGNRCKSVVVITSRFVRGLVFYDKSGPLAYWYNEQGTEAVRQLTLSVWFYAITRKRDEPFKEEDRQEPGI